MEGGSLGLFLYKACSWGIMVEFLLGGTGCELGSGYGGFLGNFLMNPIWVMWKGVWVEGLDGPRSGDIEGCLVGNF